MTTLTNRYKKIKDCISPPSPIRSEAYPSRSL